MALRRQMEERLAEQAQEMGLIHVGEMERAAHLARMDLREMELKCKAEVEQLGEDHRREERLWLREWATLRDRLNRLDPKDIVALSRVGSLFPPAAEAALHSSDLLPAEDGVVVASVGPGSGDSTASSPGGSEVMTGEAEEDEEAPNAISQAAAQSFGPKRTSTADALGTALVPRAKVKAKRASATSLVAMERASLESIPEGSPEQEEWEKASNEERPAVDGSATSSDATRLPRAISEAAVTTPEGDPFAAANAAKEWGAEPGKPGERSLGFLGGGWGPGAGIRVGNQAFPLQSTEMLSNLPSTVTNSSVSTQEGGSGEKEMMMGAPQAVSVSVYSRDEIEAAPGTPERAISSQAVFSDTIAPTSPVPQVTTSVPGLTPLSEGPASMEKVQAVDESPTISITMPIADAELEDKNLPRKNVMWPHSGEDDILEKSDEAGTTPPAKEQKEQRGEQEERPSPESSREVTSLGGGLGKAVNEVTKDDIAPVLLTQTPWEAYTEALQKCASSIPAALAEAVDLFEHALACLRKEETAESLSSASSQLLVPSRSSDDEAAALERRRWISRLWAHLGQTRQKLGETRLAMSAYRNALDTTGLAGLNVQERAVCLANLAQLSVAQGKKATGRALLMEAVHADPDNLSYKAFL